MTSPPWLQSLQVRLALVISLVLIVVTFVIGSVTVAVQNDNLMRRVDQQLRISLEMATGLSREASVGLWPDTDKKPLTEEKRPAGPRFGSLNLTLTDGYVTEAEAVDGMGNVIILDESQIDELLRAVVATSGPSNVNLTDLGNYRVIGVSTANTNKTIIVVVGQSLADVQKTTRGLIVTFTLAGVTGVLVASLASVWLVRRSLRPLEELRETAANIGKTPLATGAVSLSTRVDDSSFTPGTEVGDLAESFNQMLDHVEEALQHRAESEAKLKQFAADASHELRTPLSNVSGYAEFASRRKDNLPSDVVTSLERIGSESARMSGIVEELLLLARMDSAQTQTGEQTQAARAVLDCASDAAVTAPDKTWKTIIDDNATSVMVPMSAEHLHQAVANLTGNAALHTPAGTTVLVSAQVSADGVVVIRVEDDGPGIPPELAPKVFDRFVRADIARTGGPDTSTRSTGLGLSITEALVRNAGGSLTLDSVPGRTVFSIYLPKAN